jgi:hypothetical protein
MKIKIIKSMKDNLWYSKLIGNEKEVTMMQGLYVLKSNPFYKLYVEDCTVVDNDEFKAEIEAFQENKEN